MFEALMLHFHIWKFFFCHSTHAEISKLKELVKEALKKKTKTDILFYMVLLMLVSSLSVPLLGMSLEIKHGHEANCKDYIYEHHTVYWILDIFRYLHDVTIRVLMFLATVAVGEIWFIKVGEYAQTAADSTNCRNYATFTSPQDAHVLAPGDGTNSQAEAEPRCFDDYLEDRKTVIEDYKERTKDYFYKGQKVERILKIFQTWFLIPWLLFYVGSSLDADHILKSWKDGPTDDGYYEFSELTYLVYNLNQLILLIFSLLCSVKMNSHHCNYISQLKSEQFKKFKTASRIALMNMNKIEKEDKYDFTPRILCTNIKVQIDSSLYVLLFLVGIFFTIIETLA